MKEITVLITGGNGQLGRALQEASAFYPDCIFHFYTRKALDITDKAQVREKLRICKPDILINTAAYTSVDKAESDSEKAFLVNEKGTGILAELSGQMNIPMVHLSTDYVYDSASGRPLKETDPTNPSGVYAQSKLAGEKLAIEANNAAYIIRTSWVYGVYGSNFVKTMLRLGKAGRSLKVINDQTGSPTNAHDLANTLLDLLPKMISGEMKPGVYNYCNSGETTWYEFAKTIFSESEIQVELTAVPTSEYPTPAKRPAYSVLDTSKISAILDEKIPRWDISLVKYLKRIEQSAAAPQ